MAITCKELLQDEYLKDKIRLLAGQNSINNAIMWFYIAGDIKLGDVMPGGGELLFMQNNFVNTPLFSQIDYIDSCVKRHVPGMVLVGRIENNNQTELILNYGEKLGLPIFVIDNPMEVVGITKRLSGLIMQDEDDTKRIRSFMRDIMNDEEMSISAILRRGFSCNINLRSPFFFISLGCNYGNGTDEDMLDGIIRFRDNLDYIFSEIEQICRGENVKLLKYSNGWQSLCLISLDQTEAYKQYDRIVADFDKFLETYRKDSGLNVTAGYSNLGTNAEEIKLCCHESERALEFVSRSETGKISMAFKNLGIMRFIAFLSEKEKCEIIDYAKSELHPLIESDEKNNTEYVRTYRIYLYSDGTLQNIADDLYIHRNTLIKRLEQIEKLLNKDIHNPLVKNEAMNILFVLDYFGINLKSKSDIIR